MDQAIRVHKKYLDEGLSTQAEALIASESPKVQAFLNKKLLIDGAGYGIETLVTPKAAARLKAADIEEKQKRLMELRAKAGR
jgi:hypothetical protein